MQNVWAKVREKLIKGQLEARYRCPTYAISSEIAAEESEFEGCVHDVAVMDIIIW